MGFSRNVFTTTKKNPGSLGARIIYAQIRYSSITPLLAGPRTRRTLFSVHTCVRACMRAYVFAHESAVAGCAGRCESACSMGYHPRVRGRVSCKRKKRGRGEWAWFVFEVESTLHLLFPSFEGGAHRPSRITSSESLANSHLRPPFSCRDMNERVDLHLAFARARGDLLIPTLIGVVGRVWISYVRSFVDARSLPESEGGIYGVCRA